MLRSVKIHATQQAVADTFRENFHGTYTDFAISFCENPHHARIPTHRRIRLRMEEADRFCEHENFLLATFRGQDLSLNVQVCRRIKLANATYSK